MQNRTGKKQRPDNGKGKNSISGLNRMNGITKLLICLGLAICSFILLFVSKLETITATMFSWDFFCLSMITIDWIIFFKTSGAQLGHLAEKQDESLPVIFIIVVVSVCFSLFGTLLLLMSKEINFIDKELSSLVSLLGIGFSWLLLHTIFAIRYAHEYYGTGDQKDDAPSGGLDFPEEKKPDYMDFAYFSFVIGMTFQVSDVSISSRKLRRLVLVHSIISFAFNAVIVALTISLIANLK